MSRLWLCVAITAVAGCRCPGGTITPTEAGFRVDTAEIDFGRVSEGGIVDRELSLVATGSADITLDLATDGPFVVQASVTIPGGSSLTVLVRFIAGTTAVIGEVRISANGAMATTKLKGVGVKPKICVASTPCKKSEYSLATDSCVESDQPEGALCQPNSLCLEKGECRAGVCQGVARQCDDDNACTDDSCSMEVGCLHSLKSCPVPTAACKVATCDAATGCGQGTAPDGQICGTLDCVNAHLCVSGACATVATPEGFVCGPATPCQGESKCKNQKCVAPDAGTMMPRTIVKLPGTVVNERPSLVAHNGNLFFQLCGLAVPDGGSDGGVDGGSDGGPDAGPQADTGCGLVSFTGTGFERWTVRYPDDAPRRLVYAGARGVVLLQDGALDVHLLSTGAVTHIPLGGQAVPRGVAQGPDFEVWAVVNSDAGTRLVRWADGGLVEPVVLDAGASLLAIDELGAAWLYGPDAGTLGAVVPDVDGGTYALSWQPAPVGLSSLNVAERSVITGGTQLLNLQDGGRVGFTWLSDAGAALEVLPRPMVSGVGAGLAFYRECETPVMSCADADKDTWVHAFSLRNGSFLWRAKVLPSQVEGRIEEVALAGVVPGAVGVLVQVRLNGGPQAYLQGFADGDRVLLCPMLEGTQLAGAAFTLGNLHVLVRRNGGPWQLETYDTGALPLLTTGWPQADGISGARRAR